MQQRQNEVLAIIHRCVCTDTHIRQGSQLPSQAHTPLPHVSTRASAGAGAGAGAGVGPVGVGPVGAVAGVGVGANFDDDDACIGLRMLPVNEPSVIDADGGFHELKFPTLHAAEQ